jgi:hypothetical protein
MAASQRVESRVAAVEVGVEGRWDALALSEILMPWGSFLVQLDRERWVVHARVPGYRGESLDEAVAAIEGWLVDRGLEDITCRIDGELLEVGERRVA